MKPLELLQLESNIVLELTLYNIHNHHYDLAKQFADDFKCLMDRINNWYKRR